MRLRRLPARTAGALLSVVVLGGLLATATATASVASAQAPSAGFHTTYGADGESDVNVCSADQPAGYAHCDAHRRTDRPATTARPARVSPARAGVLGNNGAYDPSYLQSAYNVPATHGAGQTVAIVDAYDDPNAEADLAAYRSFYGLPACTSGSGCFTKVNESGATAPLPGASVSWSQEISLDLDMVSAICPNCKILLVEANSNGLVDLGTGVNTAVALGANAVSNSYGGSEFSSEATYADAYYNHPGVAITVSSGDDGYGVEFPAAAATVTAVGGTSLKQTGHNGTRNATENVWAGAGSGCSAYIAKPMWQTDIGCVRRTVADVSAVANPSTGVWVYDTYGTGFTQAIFGGTSASSPIIASLYALAENPASADTLSSYPYGHKSSLFDVKKGTNGTCPIGYLCGGHLGYDGPTGLGTPNGSAAFVPGGALGTVPSPVPTFTAATSATKGVDLSWSVPASDGGSPITSYELSRSGTSGAEKPKVAVVCTTATCTYTDTTAKSGKIYYYLISAVNGIGGSQSTIQVSVVAK